MGKAANPAKKTVSRNVNLTADSAKKTLKSQKSGVSAKSTNRSRSAKVEKQAPKTGGLTQKQKDDRKRASKAYRDRQKKLHQENFNMLDQFKARFEAFSAFIADTCNENQKTQIQQRMDQYDQKNPKKAGTSSKEGSKNKLSRKNSLNSSKDFVAKSKLFVGFE